tara:strand:+ start:1875 stop:2090 length:216 start_codon:yes stop_codon:yes gene_type:complete
VTEFEYCFNKRFIVGVNVEEGSSIVFKVIDQGRITLLKIVTDNLTSMGKLGPVALRAGGFHRAEKNRPAND